LTKQAGSGSEFGSDQLYPEPEAEAKNPKSEKGMQIRKHDTSRGAGSGGKKYSTASISLVSTFLVEHGVPPSGGTPKFSQINCLTNTFLQLFLYIVSFNFLCLQADQKGPFSISEFSL